MATLITSEIGGIPIESGIARAADRWIFVFMAALFIAIALTGFIPDSIDKVAAVRAGTRPPFPIVMHIHSVLMGAFLLILFAQTWLAATGHLRGHQQLGMMGAALVPLLVIVGGALAVTIFRETQDMYNAAPPDARARLATLLTRKANVLLSQIRMGVLFPLFMIIGLRARTRDSGLHKRMMILATAVVLPPPLSRMTWLPTDFPKGFVMQDVYVLLSVSPMFLWDIMRTHRIHRAYWLWLSITAPFAIAVHSLWGTPWWQATARSILGA